MKMLETLDISPKTDTWTVCKQKRYLLCLQKLRSAALKITWITWNEWSCGENDWIFIYKKWINVMLLSNVHWKKKREEEEQGTSFFRSRSWFLLIIVFVGGCDLLVRCCTVLISRCCCYLFSICRCLNGRTIRFHAFGNVSTCGMFWLFWLFFFLLLLLWFGSFRRTAARKIWRGRGRIREFLFKLFHKRWRWGALFRTTSDGMTCRPVIIMSYVWFYWQVSMIIHLFLLLWENDFDEMGNIFHSFIHSYFSNPIDKRVLKLTQWAVRNRRKCSGLVVVHCLKVVLGHELEQWHAALPEQRRMVARENGAERNVLTDCTPMMASLKVFDLNCKFLIK